MSPRLRAWVARLVAPFRRRHMDGELRQELAAHVEEAGDDYIRRGVAPGEARRLALRDLGGFVQAEEAHREARTWSLIATMWRDVRQAARSLRRQPAFTGAVLAVLTVCTTAVVSVFTMVQHVVLRPLPFADADRLVQVGHAAPGIGVDETGVSAGLYFHYREHVQTLSAMGLYQTRAGVLQTDAGSERVTITSATVAFFQILGVSPAHGRLFTEADAAPGFLDTTWEIPVLLSHRLWVDRFGGDPGIVDRSVVIGNRRRKVVGILPASFQFPDSRTQLWMLTEPQRRGATFARDFGYSAIARLEPGRREADVVADLSASLRTMAGRFADATPERVAEVRLTPLVTPLKAAVIGRAGTALWPLFGAMLLLLVFAGLNVGGLFLARSEQRRREFALRRALGAGAGQVARVLFVEALLLTASASLAGVALSAAALPLLLRAMPVTLPRAGEISTDLLSLTCALAIALILAGALAWSAGRRHRFAVSAVPAVTGAWATGDRRGRRTRDVLIALQVALALAMIAGSALMVATYRSLTRIDPGFESAGLLTMEVALPGRKASRHTAIMTTLAERIRALPGVIAASAVSSVPMTPDSLRAPIRPNAPPVAFRFFLPGYFEVMKIPTVAGTSMPPGALRPSGYPVLINASLAARLAPGRTGLGESIQRLNDDGSVVDMLSPVTQTFVPVPPFSVVGVMGDVRDSLRETPGDVVYVPVIDPVVEQSIVPIDMTLVVRTGPPPLELTGAIRRLLPAVDPDLSVGQVETLAAIVARSRGAETMVGGLLVAAAAVSLLLGLIGIYGSVVHAARLRRREVGIRVALGAAPRLIVRDLARDAIGAAAAGVILGVGLSLMANRALSALLYDVAPDDSWTLSAAAAVLLASAALTALAAAWRATVMDPLEALRSE